MRSLILFVLCSCSLHSFAQTDKEKDIAAIKASRLSSNESISRHDMNGIAKYWLPEVIVIGGNGGAKVGYDSVYASLKRQLDQVQGLAYVRTPTAINISDADTLAFETGKWMGLKTNNKSPKWLGGKYTAMWWKQDGIWKIRSELFVTLEHY